MKGETRISAFPTKRLKYLVTLRRSPVTEDDATLPYIGLENIESGTGRLADDGGINSETSSLPDEGRKASGIYFECGDVLFGKLRPYLMKSWVAEFPGRCTAEALVMTPHAIEARFLRSVCLSPKFVDTVDASTFESKMPRAEWSFIGNMPVPVPDWERQRVIADFLDRETERLDALVAAKERLLELLAEKRQALIDHAVTGCLDPQALSCDAGASTAGEGRVCVAGSCEPEHDSQHMWPVKRLRFLTQDGISSRRRRILTDAEKVTFLPMENIGDQGEIDRSIIRDIDDVRGGYTQFFDGDVLVAKITPCFENGKGALVNGTLSGVGYGTTELHVLAPGDEIDGRFLYYVTVGRTFRGLGEAAMYGAAGQKRVPEEFIRNYPVPAPPYAQQRTIADYLDRETARIDELAARTRDTIALLRERRAALVAAAVTGQIDMERAS